MKRERILVVDDERRMLHSVRRLLADRYEVETAPSGRKALELVEAFDPDLAILDVRMPEIDGFELMSGLRQICPGVDVIFMTGAIHEVDAQLIRAVRERAFYFVQKPFDRDVLLTLVERCLEQRRLEAENRTYVHQLERELDDARTFQLGMLPPESARVGSFSVHAHYEPSERLSGDFYDHLDAGEGALAFLIADVSGHGVSAAMLTANVKSALHDAQDEGYAPLAVVERLSSSLRSFDDGRFVTVFCGLLRADRTLEYVNAGHPPPLVTTPEGVRRELTLTGPLVSPVLAGLAVWGTSPNRALSRRALLLLHGRHRRSSRRGRALRRRALAGRARRARAGRSEAHRAVARGRAGVRGRAAHGRRPHVARGGHLSPVDRAWPAE